MTKGSPSALAATLVFMVIGVLVFVKPIASLCYKYDHYGPPFPLSRQELQWWYNQKLARFAVTKHNEVLPGSQQLKLVSVDEGTYYHASPTIEIKSFNITASNSVGRAKYRAFVSDSMNYDELGLECFEKI
ncbi:unnamed protein product [Linum trigynum]|uniref:Uncharacterized protein n=1 Tax=Linum trigynum TaxID=586398 RepID=A0AAV2EI16_9ROSI